MSQELVKRIEAPQTLERFSKIFGAVNKVEDSQAKQMFEVEKFHFLKELTEKGLSDFSDVSGLGVFLDVVSNGMSFASSSKHVYLMTRSVKAGNGYEKRLVFSTSPDGKIFLAQRAGSIDYVTKPVIVYEGDDFAVGTNDQGQQIIRHNVKLPRESNRIIAGYVYVVMKNGNREPYWMDLQDIERLKGYSAKQSKGNANALYTANGGQIDPGFFGAKLINFALKNVRKSGIASAFEVDDEITEQPLPEIPETATYTATSITAPAQPVSEPVNNFSSPVSDEPF